MEKLERIHNGLQFSPSTTNYISSKRSSKKTQKKKIEKTPDSDEFGVYPVFLEINT